MAPRRIYGRMLTGTYTAIVTPFRNGVVHYDALRQLIERQVKGGVDGVVPVGTTGESPTLNYEEHVEVIALTVEFARGRIKVIAGTGGNSTDEAIYLTKKAEQVGADSTLQVAPYYNRPTQEGLFQHFLAVSKATKLPVILYSIPSRCGVEIAVETVQRLANAAPGIVGIKEAGGNADRVSQLRAVMGARFSIFCGDDSLTLPFMSVGAHGVVSVASNIIPAAVVQLTRACLRNDFAAARKVHDKYYALFKNLFIETNPSPVKAVAAMLGQMTEDVRLPLVPISGKSRSVLKSTLIECNLLKK